MRRSVFLLRPRSLVSRAMMAFIAGGTVVMALAACSTGTSTNDLVFTSERDSDNPDIYTVSSSGGEAQRLTNTSATEKDPIWSPNGDQIAFLSDRGDDFELYIMDAEGETEQVAVGGEGERSDFAWGPDGNRIAYVSDHEGEEYIYVKDLIQNQEFQLSITHDTRQQLGSWSPDGEWLAFSVLEGDGKGIYRKNPGGVDEVQLTQDSDESPIYSPDGKYIAFVSWRDSEESEIYVMNAEGEDERNLTRKPGADFDFDWSPDSKNLVFISERDGNREIYLISIEGDDPKRLTTNSSAESSPRFSPGGNRIVFVSDSDGDSDLFSMRRDGTDQKRITATGKDDEQPDW